MSADTMWQHHSNPWSGWTRSLTQPFLCLPLWHRSWKQGVVLAAWLAVNPYIFPAPKDPHAWMTRAILGERLWVQDIRAQMKGRRVPFHDPALWTGIAHALVLDAALYAAWRRRLLATVLLSMAAVGLNLTYLNQMADVYGAQTADKN